TSVKFQYLVENNGLIQSMSRRGNCWDNAPQESFYGHMKDEIDLASCEDYEDVKKLIEEYMDYYNNERYQWNLAKLSPIQYYQFC
ncbi:transposase, partial [Ruoffia sp. FAM 20857]